MSRLGIRSTIARAIVDKEWREAAFGPNGDLKKAVRNAGYDVLELEMEMLACNTSASFSEALVDMSNWESFLEISTNRIEDAASNKAPGSTLDVGTL